MVADNPDNLVFEPSALFAHPAALRLNFLLVTSKATSFVLLVGVFLSGTVAPTGVCARMCLLHNGTENQRHCVGSTETSHAMPHSPHMAHVGLRAMIPTLSSNSCQANCVAAERLAISRKVALAPKSLPTNPVIMAEGAALLMPDDGPPSRVEGSPPHSSAAHVRSFSILRI